MVFAGFGQYPKSSTLVFSYSLQLFTTASDPIAELLPAYHICFTSFAVSLLSACINGHVDKAYIAPAALSPCVTSSYDSM